MEINWKDFWKNCRGFSKKVDAEESAVANIIALLFFCSGGGLLAYGVLNSVTWAIIAGLITLIVGGLIFKINIAIAQCKAAEEMDNDRK